MKKGRVTDGNGGTALQTARKLPWGIFSFVGGIVWSVVTVALVAVNVISSAMIASAGSDDGLSKSGWMAALWGAEVVLTVLILAFIGMYVWKTVMSKRAKPDDGGHVNESV